MYDPFLRGPLAVGVRTFEARDTVRDRVFPCEIWYPADPQHAGQDMSSATQDAFTIRNRAQTQMAVRDAAARPGTYPLIVYSHASSFHRRVATFLCTHLCSHGYVVAALDHFEVVAALGPGDGETAEHKAARIDAMLANRVPDVRVLLDFVVGRALTDWGAEIDPALIGIVGHSFGGWTALAAPDVERRIRAVVALAPGGASQRKPGILPGTLAFAWGRDVPTLYLVAEDDVFLPLAGMFELFERTPAAKQMVILRRADHLHFADDVEALHEMVRAMPWTGELAWLPQEMRPITELCSGEQAHTFVRGLTLCHMDATLRREKDAQRFLSGEVEAALAMRDVDAIVHKP